MNSARIVACTMEWYFLKKEHPLTPERWTPSNQPPEPPRNAKELNSFPCTVQCNAKFMDKFALETDILSGLLKAEVFTWRKEHQEASECQKEVLSLDTVVAYFDPPQSI